MSKFLPFILLGFIFINFGCYHDEKQELQKNLKNQLVTLKVNNPNNDSTIFLSNFINQVKIIPLEFNIQCRLGNIKKIVFQDSSIFIQDSQNQNGIFRFNSSGKFICKIGNLGKGPSEHINLTDFSVNPKTKCIYIYSNSQKKLLEYSISNNFQKEILLGYAAENFEFKNNLFYMYRENPQLDEVFNLIIKNLEGKTITRYFRSEPDKKSSTSKVFLSLKDSFLFHRHLNDTIYCIKDENLNYAYYIDFGKYTVKPEDRLKMQEWSVNTLKLLNSNNYITGIDHLFHVKNMIFFTYVFQNIQNMYFYNIKTKKLVSSYSIIDDLSWFSFATPISQTDEYLVSVYDPSSIGNNIKYINSQTGKLIPEEQAKTATKKLDSLLQTAEPHEMNPFLILYKINNYED